MKYETSGTIKMTQVKNNQEETPMSHEQLNQLDQELAALDQRRAQVQQQRDAIVAQVEQSGQEPVEQPAPADGLEVNEDAAVEPVDTGVTQDQVNADAEPPAGEAPTDPDPNSTVNVNTAPPVIPNPTANPADVQ